MGPQFPPASRILALLVKETVLLRLIEQLDVLVCTAKDKYLSATLVGNSLFVSSFANGNWCCFDFSLLMLLFCFLPTVGEEN